MSSSTDNCTLATCPLSEANLAYVPTLPGNAIYLSLFAIILTGQIVQGIRSRTWGFLSGMFGGLFLEILGYVGRILIHNNPFDFNWFLMYLIPLTIGPAFLSASIYITLGHLIDVHGAHISRLRPRTYKLIFISSDLVALILQAAGGALAATAHDGDKKQNDLGVNVMIAGLAFQVVSLVLFMVLWAEFAWCVVKAKDQTLASTRTLREGWRFRALQWALLVATICIFIRSVFRVAELSDGFDGKLANNEVLFMVFEGPMIIVATAGLTIFHPGSVLGALWHAKSSQLQHSMTEELSMTEAGGAQFKVPAAGSREI